MSAPFSWIYPGPPLTAETVGRFRPLCTR